MLKYICTMDKNIRNEVKNHPCDTCGMQCINGDKILETQEQYNARQHMPGEVYVKRICYGRDRLETKSEIFWCKKCNVPIYEEKCPHCKSLKNQKIATDLRPVFPEERLLYELIEGKPFHYEHSSVWNAAGNRYIIDEKVSGFSVKKLRELNCNEID